MNLEGKKVGFVLTGSFCTFSKTIPKMSEIIKRGAEVVPIMSYNAYNLDTKFGKSKDFIEKIEDITKHKIIHTITDAEPIGPKKLTDIMIIAPCTGNTLGKLATRTNGYCCDNGIKISFTKQQSACHSDFNK